MTNQHKSWREEFDERFDKPICDAAHRHVVSPTSRDVYYDNSDIKSFIEKTLAAHEEIKRMLLELKDEPHEPLAHSYWHGYDVALEHALDKLAALSETV